MKKPVSKRGGARTGAGRPRVENPVVKFTVSLPFEVVQSAGLEAIKKAIEILRTDIINTADTKPEKTYFRFGDYWNKAGERMEFLYDVTNHDKNRLRGVLVLRVNGFTKAQASTFGDFARQCNGMLNRAEPDAREWIAYKINQARRLNVVETYGVNYFVPTL